MASQKIIDLGSRITEAEEALGSIFSSVQLAELQEDYKNTIKIDTMSKEFSEISNSIRKMRSSYLPIEFFLDINNDSFDTTLPDTQSESESYENTFMRMLGMPSDIHLKDQENIAVLLPDSGDIDYFPYKKVVEEILNERQKKWSSRKIKIENSALYGMWTGDESLKNTSEATVAENSTEEDILNIENSRVSVNNIDQNIFKFSHLLLPPIQDSRVSGCINESQKIVLPPFAFSGSKSINGNVIKPTLLESIIRIRLDKLSGTNTFLNEDEALSTDSEFLFSEITAPIPSSENYGLLESLFIIRLKAALGGLAIKMIEDIDSLAVSLQVTGVSPAPTSKADQDNGNNNPEGQLKYKPFSLQSGFSEIRNAGQASGIPSAFDLEAQFRSNEEQSLTNLKLIEDAVFSLLGDNSEVLDLQTQTQRNSSIHNAHMMSGLISVVNLPRSRIEERLSDINKAKLQTARAIMSPVIRDLGVSLGTDIGIGVIDIIVFSLALFTLSEESLVGLLAPEQFEKLKNGSFKNLLPGVAEQQDMTQSINELSELIIQAYNLFRDELSGD